MFDIKLIIEDKDRVVENLKNQHFNDLSIIDDIEALNEKRRKILTEAEAVRAEQNAKSKEMPTVMKNGTPEEKAAIKQELKALSEKVKSSQPEIKKIEEELNSKLLYLPNMISDETPFGKDEDDNQEIKLYGEKPSFPYTPREHFDIAKGLDFERGAKLSGARFVAYRNDVARLERALLNYMLDTHHKSGYSEVIPPILVSRETMTASGQLPKFEDDAYKTTDDMFLIPPAEVSLINMHRDEMLKEDDLPIYYAGFTPCFRREAGSYGKDTKGIIRVHQFNKVELIKFVTPETSSEELDKLLGNAEEILQGLGLHYRVVSLCSGDIGFSATKTYDIEVWLPGQDKYREISSCSNCSDFQARRGSIRFKRKDGKKPEFVHTLNGSGLAVGRTVVAVLENYQREDGSVTVPEVLRPYMNGIEVINP